MKKCTYKNYEDLPLMLNAESVGNVLGISRSSAYELMKKEQNKESHVRIYSLVLYAGTL